MDLIVIYNDSSISVSDKATRLLRDFITSIHDGLMDIITDPKSKLDARRISPLIEKLGDAIKEVIVRETVEQKAGSEDGGGGKG